MKKNSKNVKKRAAASRHKIGLEVAAPWPVFECLVSAWWRDTASLTEILIAKEPPLGGVVCCVFLVDLGCLGPKQSFVAQFRTRADYEYEFRGLMTSKHPMIEVEYSFAAKIIRESLAYSERLGFKKNSAVQRTLSALGSLDAAMECQEQIPLGGKDGKPFYMAGPEDDVEQIMKTLVATCGEGNFDFTIPQGPIPFDFFE